MSDDEYDDEACRLLATPRLLQFSPPFQDTPPKIRQVALGEGFGLCLTEEREVFMWGSFQDEEKTGRFRSKRGDWLGSNQYAFPVPELDGVTVEKVYSGPAANFCLALSTDGTLYSWGTDKQAAKCVYIT
jgi:alpha-tubulin suppressor-like RCC1 family protein